MVQSISFPERYKEIIAKEKKETGLTMSEIVRRALDYYFERKKGGIK